MSQPMYRYRAVTAGTLSNPYRYIAEGEPVVSPVELKYKWLKPEGEYRKAAALPVVPYMDSARAGKDVQQVMFAPVAPRPDYDANIKLIAEGEATRDAKAAAAVTAPAPAAQPVQQGGDAPQGSGNQEVL